MTEKADADRRLSVHAVAVRLTHIDMRKASWQRMHDLRLGPAPSHVDPDRSCLNRVLVEPPPATEMRRRAHELRRLQRAQRAPKANMAVATAGLIGFGREAQKLFLNLDADTQDRAILAIATAIADHCGCNLAGAVIHLDESAPHAHLTFESRCRVDGRPVSQIAHGPALQDIAADAIADIEPRIGRGRPRPPRPDAATVHRQVRQLHEELPAEIEAREMERDRLAREVDGLEQRRGSLAQEAGEFDAFREQFLGGVNRWNELTTQYIENVAKERAQLDEERARLAEAGIALPPRVDTAPLSDADPEEPGC